MFFLFGFHFIEIFFQIIWKRVLYVQSIHGQQDLMHCAYAGFGADSRTRTDGLRITKQMKKYEIHSKQRKTAISFIP